MAKRSVLSFVVPLAGVLVSLGAGLGVAELGARVVRGDAWPYLNVFVADEGFGVRLEASATTRTRTRTGNVTEVALNAHGFRGPDWPPRTPGSKRLLVLGDSQTFGYGVDAPQTFCARLGEALDADVLCAAVPTWGPTEYVRALADIAPREQPDAVLVIANVANDWREASVPNTRRTTARDGWARRVLRGARPVTDFPGRRWLMSRSQLVFLVREAMALTTSSPVLSARGASGLVRDLRRLRKGRDGFTSKLTGPVLAADALCARHGCALVVATLPIDVQVDAREWEKYREPAIGAEQMARTRVLADDLRADLAERGVPAVDLWPALADASPGAFLVDDPHLSARGHAAVAGALVASLRDALGRTPRERAGIETLAMTEETK